MRLTIRIRIRIEKEESFGNIYKGLPESLVRIILGLVPVKIQFFSCMVHLVEILQKLFILKQSVTKGVEKYRVCVKRV